jgi:hypothetical protein
MIDLLLFCKDKKIFFLILKLIMSTSQLGGKKSAEISDLWSNAYMRVLGVDEQQKQMLYDFCCSASKLVKQENVPDAITWVDNSDFMLVWFSFDFFILLDNNSAIITKLPGSQINNFDNSDLCINHLLENYNVYFSNH